MHTLASEASKPAAVAYTRVSTSKQERDGGSLSVQRDRLVEHAVLAGLDLVGVFSDAVSGSKGEDDRPGLKAALDLIRARKASVLLVCDRDRLARDADEAGHAAVEIRRAGGRLVILSETRASVEERAVRTLLATLEREKVRARMRTWSAARKAKGLPMGPAPFGFAKDDEGRLVPDPAERKVVARIRRALSSGTSLRVLAAKLNAEGTLRRGQPWTRQTLANVAGRR